jgi:predicted amidophosphoribosyltransferase
MIDSLLSLVAPHLCCGCGKIGSLLCDNCKYNIIDDNFDGCHLCSNYNNEIGICADCQSIFSRGWCVGWRTGELRKLIDDYKFENVRSTHRVLAGLLDQRIDQLPSTTVVVPVPTISSHIRIRGYDHTALLARSFARRRQLTVQPLVHRVSATVQRNASRHQRIVQAKVAFAVQRRLDPNIPYLVIDDIITTGASVTYVAKALRAAGAREIWLAAVARQPLD